MLRTRTTLTLIAVLASTVLAIPGARYLIITPDELADAVQPLAAWKTRKGMVCRVARTSETGGSAQQIRDYIVNAYHTWTPAPEFVLLVGGGSVLPAFGHGIFTDNDYGDMSGDYRAELPIGRFPCKTPVQCSTMVAKTLAYERHPDILDPSWFVQGTTIVREDYDPEDDSIYWQNARYASSLAGSAGFRSIDSLSSLRGSSSMDVISSVNRGTSFLLYRGRATANWYSPFDVDPSLTNNGAHLPVVCSFTCQTLSLAPYAYDTMIGDVWLKVGTPMTLKGGVAFVGNTHSASNIAHKRSATCRGWFSGIFIDSLCRIGEVFLRAKRQLYDEYRDSTEYLGINLLGDPELNLWTSVPFPLDVDYDTLLNAGQDSILNVTVQTDGSPVAHALVCIGDTATTYLYGYTDAIGSVAFHSPHFQACRLQVTVTARNAIPHEGSIRVLALDVAARSIFAPTGSVLLDTAIIPSALVVNSGSTRADLVARLQIGALYSDTVSASLDPGAAETLTFSPWRASQVGDFEVRCTTLLPNDVNPADNLCIDSVTVIPPSASWERPTRGGNASGFRLDHASPSPFRSRTTIEYCLPAKSQVNLAILSPDGIVQRLLDSGLKPAGIHSVIWDGRDGLGRILSRGIYFCQLRIGSRSATLKVTKTG